nr:DUF488 family protein [Actinomyces sp.]
MSLDITLKSVRDQAGPEDGYRVLVDRLWPRGVSRERAALDEWCQEVAPSPELRRGFHHGQVSWEDFQERYRAELAQPERAEALAHLRGLAQRGRLTLLYGTRNGDQRSNAPVLRQVLLRR